MVRPLREPFVFRAERLCKLSVERCKLRAQVCKNGNSDLGGDRRSSGADVCRKVAESVVGLVPDGGNRRDLRRRDGADERFVVEAEKVLETAAAARDDEHVGLEVAVLTVEVLNAGDNRLWRVSALHLRGEKPYLEIWEPSRQDSAHVVYHGAGLARDDSDSPRHRGERALSRRVEQPFTLELRLELEILLHQVAKTRKRCGKDNDLVVAARRIDGNVAEDLDLGAVL